ncbi:hypothetical protein PR202_ga23011 [Eleusine coracana subsp. coracana]|uniref:trimethyltridecatetraene synthase n=1 Tax=Eleusine coracana subsp. coracana TaxID=191504 RepID=A0AAV5D4Q4_ELECO|nr:hypothetical protein QOZ80_1AG0015040 [Eleusine coracana subsp. coracana]GJN05390.1 hypothetical protein PR202_ga23011 [Eleusine coracana subsp. coracana]
MELFTFTVALATTLSLVIIVIRYRRRACKYNLPPGPRPWPIIGNLNLLGPLTHRSLRELSLQYGPLMSMWTGSIRIVVASSGDAARLILKTNDEAFIDRPLIAIGRYLFYNHSDMFWAPYGAYWRQARKLWHTKLLSEKQLKLHEHVRREEVQAMLRDLHAASSSNRRPVQLRDHLLMLNLNVISRMMMSKKYGVDEASSMASSKGFPWMVEEMFILKGSLNIGDVIPWLNWLDLQGYISRIKSLSKMMDAFLEHMLNEHDARRLQEGESFVPKDMVDVLLQLADDPNMEIPITRDGIKGFVLDMIAAGTDTTAVTVEWALSELLKNPMSFAKATEELDRVVGRDPLPTEKDAISLPFIQAVMKESMRLHPATPLLSPRRCHKDASIGSYRIPAGTCVAINAWAIGRDPAVWEAPEEFRPERFMESKVDVKGQDFDLLPFGSGRRMCPGMGLALKMAPLTLAYLLHAFAWRLPDGVVAEEVDMEERLRFTMPRNVPLEAVGEPKLPAHLYYPTKP